MKSTFVRVLGLALVLAVLISALPVAAAPNLARVRVAHFSPDAPTVDILVGGQASGIQSLSFGQISGWVELPAGSYSFAVVPAGTGVDQAAIGPATFNLPANSWTTVAAIGSLANGTLRAATVAEDYRPVKADEVRVTVFHGIEDAPAVDVILPDGTKVVSNLAFGRAETVTVPSGTYDLSVVAAGTSGPAVISLPGTALPGATYVFVAATNRLAEPQVVVSAIGLSAVSSLINKVAPAGTIVDIAVSDSRFSTLVAAVKAAGLVDTLAGEGPFTVFAPTNAAFAKLPAGTLDAVLADKELLTNILLYHVVAGRAVASDVVNLSSLNMLRGVVSVEVRDGSVYLNGNTKIVITDIPATNGVIHVIDTVLIP